MTTVIIDYGSGNLHSAEKAFSRMAAETGAGGPVVVTDDPGVVEKADRIVLPGVGAFADCARGVAPIFPVLEARVIGARVPFLGICVGQQLMATVGREYVETSGFGWIAGAVEHLTPTDASLKMPHMGWNALMPGDHPLFEGISAGDHAYFVHSYHMKPDNPAEVLATCDYGGPVTAAVGRANMAGTQFHPEKSQSTGLCLIANFLKWMP